VAQRVDREGLAPAAGEATAVEDGHGLVEQVVGDDFADDGDRFGRGGVLFPRGPGPRDRQAVFLAAGEPQRDVDVLAGLEQRDVGDEQSDEAFAFPHRGGGVAPERGQVAGQCPDAFGLGVAEPGAGAATGAVVVVLGVVEVTQPLVPVRFEGVSDEPVAGVDGEVAAAGGIGGVAGPFDVGGADAVGVGGPVGEFAADGDRGLDRERGERVQDEVGDGGVDACAGHVLARRGAGGDAFELAGVVGDEGAVAAPVVVHGHQLTALAADEQALQQCGSFAGRAGAAVVAAGRRVRGELGLGWPRTVPSRYIRHGRRGSG